MYVCIAFYVRVVEGDRDKKTHRVIERSSGVFCQEQALKMKPEGKWDGLPGAVCSLGCFSLSRQWFPPCCAWGGIFSNAHWYHPKRQQQELELVFYLQYCNHRFWKYGEFLGQGSQDPWPISCLSVVFSSERRLWDFHHATWSSVYKGE